MSLSLYEVSVAQLIRMLGNLSAMIDKAQAHADAKGVDPATLVEARLSADMLPFKNQVYMASDTAKGCAARLAGLESPSFPDTEVTLPELKERVAKTIAYLETFKPDQIDGQEERAITVRFSPEFAMEFTGRSYVLGFAMPNFFFHVTTAYALLRAGGVEIGKRDFLGGI